MAEKCHFHPDQDIRFFCKQCLQVVCRDCMMAKHSGHKAEDIAEAAQEAKASISKAAEQHKDRIDKVRVNLKDAETNLTYYETSARYARAGVDEMFDRMAKTLEELRQGSISSMEHSVTRGRQEQQRYINELRQNDLALTRQLRWMNEALQSASTSKIITTRKRLLEEWTTTASDELVRNAPGFTFEVSFVDFNDVEQFGREIKRFISRPALAQMSKTFPSMSIAHVFRCSENTDSSIAALHPMGNNQICVVYTEEVGAKGKDGKKGKTGKRKEEERGKQMQYVLVFDVQSGGSLLREKVGPENKKVQILDNSTSSLGVTLYPSVSGVGAAKATTFTFHKSSQLHAGHSPDTKRCCHSLRKTLTGKYVVRDETQSDDNADLFQIKVEDPVTVCANSTGEYFAVIHTNSQSGPRPATPKPTRSLCVSLFRRAQSNRIALFQSGVDGFLPSAVCFYTLDDTEMLLVADEYHDTVYSVNFLDEVDEDGFLRQFEEIGSGCPWMGSPTALAVDRQGTLWVGCKGGHVSKCIPPVSCYELPKTPTSDNEPSGSDFSNDSCGGSESYYRNLADPGNNTRRRYSYETMNLSLRPTTNAPTSVGSTSAATGVPELDAPTNQRVRSASNLYLRPVDAPNNIDAISQVGGEREGFAVHDKAASPPDNSFINICSAPNTAGTKHPAPDTTGTKHPRPADTMVHPAAPVTTATQNPTSDTTATKHPTSDDTNGTKLSANATKQPAQEPTATKHPPLKQQTKPNVLPRPSSGINPDELKEKLAARRKEIESHNSE